MASYWRKLRAAALVLRLLRSRGGAGSSTAHKINIVSTAFPFEPNACCARRKKELLRRIIAKPFYCRSEVDIKLLAGVLHHCKFNDGLSSASTDALARALHFRVIRDGEVLFRQGDAIEASSGRFLVIRGSLLLFSHRTSTSSSSLQGARSGTPGKFGECVGTCNPGTICGEDAISDAMARKTSALAQKNTLVAFVTRADYLRIARFNVDAETDVLGGTSLLFKKTESVTPLQLDPEVLRDRQNVRVVKRFLHRYECFRSLPHEFHLRLAQKLQFHTFKAGERLHPVRDGDPKMFFILSGECCVHLLEPSEEGHLETSTTEQKCDVIHFNTFPSKSKTNDTTDACKCCKRAHNQAPDVVPLTHICTLLAGDAFGETYLSSPSMGLSLMNGDGVVLSIPSSSLTPSCAVSVSINEYFTVRSCYLDSMDFTASRAYTILSSEHPRDRTCEQVSYVAAYLTRQSPAKLLFSQFPPAITREICLHATLEKFPTDGKVQPCIQEQGKDLRSFRIVLNGRLGIFKTLHHGDSEEAGISRSENTDLLGCGSTSRHEGSVEPVGVLSCGSAFGLLPVLLSSTSSYSYVAYGAPGPWGKSVDLLSIPASLTKLYFSTLDEYLVYRPIRALKHAVGTARAASHSQFPNSRKQQAMDEFERFICHCPAVAGIPRSKLRTMVDRMVVVKVPSRYFVFEAGEYTKGCIFIVLEGSVRTFRCTVTDRERKSSIRSKGGSKDVPRLEREGTGDFASDEGPSNAEHARFSFTKPVDDDFYGREYKYVVDMSEGACFGRHGALDAPQGATQQSANCRSSHKLGVLSRKATVRRFPTKERSSVYPETVITTSNCRLGILCSDPAEENAFPLASEKKMELISFMDNGIENGSTRYCNSHGSNDHQKSDTAKMNASVSTTCCEIIKRMGLARKMKTHQLIGASKALKHVEVNAGDTVYRSGEEGTALYFILSGRVRLSNGQEERAAITSKAISSPEANDFWSVELSEGDVFGDEFLMGGMTSSTRRHATAVAVNGDRPLRLVYLLLDDYLSVWDIFSHENDQSPQDLHCCRRPAIDRWKAAVFLITRARTPWASTLQANFKLRTELTFTMVHELPLFKDIPKQSCQELCKNCSIEVMSVDNSVFEWGDEVLDQMFVVVSGAVTIQQLVPTSMQTTVINAGIDEKARVSVRVMKSGDSFGEFELLLDVSKRLVDATVSRTDTTLLQVPMEIFNRFWPQRKHSESKLMTLKRAFDATSPLEPEQLCAMYYSVNCCSFKRNDVVFGSNTHRGTLLVIESGLCVVHDYITLQKKRPQKPAQGFFPLQPRAPTPKLALDTPVATLGPLTILFAESTDTSTSDANVFPDREYIVAESPVVNVFTVKLYAIASKDAPTGPTSRRNHDLHVVTLLGHGGLQMVRSAIAAQRKWRAESSGVSLRLAQATAPNQTFGKMISPNTKRATHLRSPRKVQDSPMQMELLNYLRDRQLPPHKIKEPPVMMGLIVGPPIPHTNSSQHSTGSFPVPSVNGRAKSFFPALRPNGQYQEGKIQQYVDSAVVAASMRSSQLMKEARTVAELSVHTLAGPRLSSAMEKRQRHGRPPSRQLESRDRLVDIFPADTNFESERRKAGLCRRLLHIKGSDNPK